MGADVFAEGEAAEAPAFDHFPRAFGDDVGIEVVERADVGVRAEQIAEKRGFVVGEVDGGIERDEPEFAAITEFARNKGLAQIEGLVLAHNSNMLKLMRHLGFQIKPFDEDPDFKLAVKVL